MKFHHELICHPIDAPAKPKLSIHCSGELEQGRLACQFLVAGKLDSILLPENSDMGTRRDRLWEFTCLEFFLLSHNASYLELNVSPALDWNLYAFDGYRQGMREFVADHTFFDCLREDGLLRVNIELNWSCSSEISKYGISAVLKHSDRKTSHWALKHPKDRPDFHDEQGYQNFLRSC